jgi:abequosyltransferase
MDKPILSICIPTYNRAKYLDEAIESIINQVIDSIKDKVEICISDNCSEDNTEDIISKWQAKAPIPITYHRNSVNLGVDRNFLKVVEIANGDYCWFLGSDDKIAGNGVLEVLNNIYNFPDVDVFLCNRDEYNNDFSKKLGSSRYLSSEINIFDFSKMPFYGYLKLCRGLGGVFSYISSLIFKKTIWEKTVVKENITNCGKYINSGYIHTYILVRSLSEGLKLKYIESPLILCRLFNEDEKSLDLIFKGYKRIYIDYIYYLIFAEIFGLDSKEVYYIKKLLNNNLRWLLFIKRNLIISKSFKEYESLKRLLWNIGLYRNFIIVIIIPAWIIELFHELFRRFPVVKYFLSKILKSY